MKYIDLGGDAYRQGRREGYEDAARYERLIARGQLIRALVAQQWAVACTVFCEPGMSHSVIWMVFENNVAGGLTKDLAALPCAADLVAEILGGEG